MIVEELRQRGYSVQKDFLNAEEIRSISAELNDLFKEGIFREASIGNQGKAHKDSSIRGDQTSWFNTEAPTSAQQIILSALEEVRLRCNQELFLGLLDLEGHYALYPENSFYQKHRDSFKDDDSRVLSAVIYFNLDWKNGDGGELLLHCDPPVLVEPCAGTLVLFLSREIEHEVLRAHKLRKSFAGWFKRRAT